MKLYQTVVETEEASFVTWSGSQADASKARSAYKKDGFKHPDTLEVEVPTNKVDLLKFLNDAKVIA